jgi:hypothetical protein
LKLLIHESHGLAAADDTVFGKKRFMCHRMPELPELPMHVSPGLAAADNTVFGK